MNEKINEEPNEIEDISRNYYAIGRTLNQQAEDLEGVGTGSNRLVGVSIRLPLMNKSEMDAFASMINISRQTLLADAIELGYEKIFDSVIAGIGEADREDFLSELGELSEMKFNEEV